MRPVDGVRLASLSFDRTHDSPGDLAAYARRYRAEPERWLVAAPESDAALTRLLRETGVVVIDDGMGGYAHNAAIQVVTASGRLMALFDLQQYREALAYASTL
jgi:protein SCO1/2